MHANIAVDELPSGENSGDLNSSGGDKSDTVRGDVIIMTSSDAETESGGAIRGGGAIREGGTIRGGDLNGRGEGHDMSRVGDNEVGECAGNCLTGGSDIADFKSTDTVDSGRTKNLYDISNTRSFEDPGAMVKPQPVEKPSEFNSVSRDNLDNIDNFESIKDKKSTNNNDINTNSTKFNDNDNLPFLNIFKADDNEQINGKSDSENILKSKIHANGSDEISSTVNNDGYETNTKENINGVSADTNNNEFAEISTYTDIPYTNRNTLPNSKSMADNIYNSIKKPPIHRLATSKLPMAKVPTNKFAPEDEFAYIGLLKQLNANLVYAYNFHQILKELITFNDEILKDDIQFDFIIENQRGMKVFGMPLYNHKLLFPFIDPPHYTSIHNKKVSIINNKLTNYPLLYKWKYVWDSWFILMFNDVDTQGWNYSYNIFSNHNSWNGEHSWYKFIRKRIWIRLRKRVDE